MLKGTPSQNLTLFNQIARLCKDSEPIEAANMEKHTKKQQFVL